MSLTPAQLALRKTGIGASEIGSIIGADGAYESPLGVWARKVGLVEDADDTETPEHIELGNLLEPVIATLYARRTGFELYEPGTLVHPTDSLRIATPDRLVRGMPRGAQIKKARSKGSWGQEGSDDVPENILTQVQWEMSVADLEVEDVPVLFWGAHVAVYTVRRDDELINGIAELAHKWWRDHVVANVPPDPDGSERTKEALSKIYPKNRGKCVALGAPEFGTLAGQVFALAHEYTSARDGGKDVEERKEAAGNALRMLIGENDGFYAPWGRCTWKRPAGGRVDWKAIAEALGVTPELVAEHTSEPTRTLSVHLKGNK